MLDTEFKFYSGNRYKLIINYQDKFVVIKGKKVIGIYESHSEAYSETIKNEELGTFLIKHILKDKNLFSRLPTVLTSS